MSSTNAVCAMSPKSMMPETRRSSSRSRLSSVRSLWITCERRIGQQLGVAEEARHALLVPEDDATGGRMEEAAQRMADPRDHGADGRHVFGGQVTRFGVPPRQERQQTDEMRGLAGRQDAYRAAVQGRSRDGNGQAGI